MISATLVWSDQPGYLDCKRCLINDLDLYLTKNNETQRIFPNGLDEADFRNNAERVLNLLLLIIHPGWKKLTTLIF